VISVTSNLMPAEVVRATKFAIDGRLDEARRAHLALMPLHEAMFLEANPGPVKAALAMRGVMKATVRSPLVSVNEGTRVALAAAMDAYARSAR
jgi:4-hydroxy-tetrahydrodipicolinate synthase